MIVGVRDVNSFISKKSEYPLPPERKHLGHIFFRIVRIAAGAETFVRHFVLKDDTGVTDCVLWADTSDKFLELLQVGNLVEVVGPDVRSRQESDKFRGARNVSPYELHVSTSRGGCVQQYAGEEAFREPIITEGWMPLGDLLQLGDQLIDAEVSILACVKKVYRLCAPKLTFSHLISCSIVVFF